MLMTTICPKCKAAISEPLGEQIKAEEERAKVVEYKLRREIVDLRGQIRVATQKIDDLLELVPESYHDALRGTGFSKADPVAASRKPGLARTQPPICSTCRRCGKRYWGAPPPCSHTNNKAICEPLKGEDRHGPEENDG